MDDESLRGKLGQEAARITEVLSPDLVNSKWKEYIEKIVSKGK